MRTFAELFCRVIALIAGTPENASFFYSLKISMQSGTMRTIGSSNQTNLYAIQFSHFGTTLEKIRFQSSILPDKLYNRENQLFSTLSQAIRLRTPALQ